MSPYREHQIERPEGWYQRALDAIHLIVDIVWPFLVAIAIVAFVGGGVILAVSAGLTSREERGAALTTEARSWSTAVGFQVVGVYCYGAAACDVSVGNAESMRVLYLHCVPGEGCVPR